jgi:asparagine N-glycosylation enzyme membrane subunit Stt3
MTDTSTAYDADSTTHPNSTTHPVTALRVTGVLALLSGSALVVDTVTIAVVNRSFDPLDTVLFLVGFVGMLLTAVALAVHAGARRTGVARLGVGLAVLVATVAALGAVAAVFDTVGRHLFPPSNIGLHGEWSFFSIGVCLLAIAAWTRRRA